MMSAPRVHYRFDMDKAHDDMVKYCHFNHQSEVACAASCLDFTKILIALSSGPRRNRIERLPLLTWSFQSKVLFPLLVRGVENCLWGWCDVTGLKRSGLWPKVKWGFENWSEASWCVMVRERQGAGTVFETLSASPSHPTQATYNSKPVVQDTSPIEVHCQPSNVSLLPGVNTS